MYWPNVEHDSISQPLMKYTDQSIHQTNQFPKKSIYRQYKSIFLSRKSILQQIDSLRGPIDSYAAFSPPFFFFVYTHSIKLGVGPLGS